MKALVENSTIVNVVNDKIRLQIRVIEEDLQVKKQAFLRQQNVVQLNNRYVESEMSPKTISQIWVNFMQKTIKLKRVVRWQTDMTMVMKEKHKKTRIDVRICLAKQ